MARQRVVFIAGLGALIPGQVSGVKDLKNYVKGAGSMLSGNPVKKTSFGSLTNPIVGGATAALIGSGALSAGLGSLGVPQNIQNLISSSVNTGGLFIELYLNPQRINEEKDKAITEVPTAAGYAQLHWGLKLTKIRFEVITRSTRSGISSAQQQSAQKAKDNLSQFKKFYETNNFNTGLIYQNQIFVGHFEGPLQIQRDVANPNIISYNFTFKIDKQPQVALPGFGVFDVNRIPFSV